MPGRVLGNYDLVGGVIQSIYVCGVSDSATATISITNRGNEPTKIFLAITDGMNAIGDNSMYLEYETELGPKQTLERQSFIVPSEKYITISSSQSNVNAVAYGYELGNEITVPTLVSANDVAAPTFITPTSFSWPDTQVIETDESETAAINYSIVSGSLPAGLSLDSNTGGIIGIADNISIVGTPTIRATDPSGNSSDRSFTITTTATTAATKFIPGEGGGGAGGGGGTPPPPPPPPAVGEHEYISPGTYSWTAPDGVTSVSVVAVGGGGGGAGDHDGAGGGGGGLGWKNDIPVTPGQTYTVRVGAGGLGGEGNSTNGNPGQDSYFIDTGTVSGRGGDRGRGNFDGSATNGGSYTGDGGGRGGNNYSSNQGSHRTGGAGAGGYSGSGGDIPSSYTSDAGSGQGGGGGGGAGGNNYQAGGGGGTGIYGQGGNGAGATYGANPARNGRGGSGGQDGQTAYFSGGSRGDGGFPGGAGGGTWYGNGSYGGYRGGHGGNGAVRIVWGDGRAFPSTNVDQNSSDGDISQN